MKKEEKWFDLQVGVDLLGQPIFHRIWVGEEESRPKVGRGQDRHRPVGKRGR
jgi:hypothetical protein